MIRSVTGEGEHSNADHLLALSEEMRDGQKIQDYVNNAKIKELVVDLDVTDRRLILHAKNTGAWTNVRGTTLIGTVLAAT